MQPDALGQLLEQCALGNRAAFADLYRQTSAKLFGVALRILRREDWAEEVLQESFVNIWRHAAAYSVYKSTPMTWMISIVRNHALDILRRPGLETAQLDPSLIEALQDQSAGPMDRLLKSNEAAALARCLQQLDGNQRQSIMLAFYYGLTHAELAKHLRQPLGTVKSWIRRGLQRLRKCLTI